VSDRSGYIARGGGAELGRCRRGKANPVKNRENRRRSVPRFSDERKTWVKALRKIFPGRSAGREVICFFKCRGRSTASPAGPGLLSASWSGALALAQHDEKDVASGRTHRPWGREEGSAASFRYLFPPFAFNLALCSLGGTGRMTGRCSFRAQSRHGTRIGSRWR